MVSGKRTTGKGKILDLSIDGKRSSLYYFKPLGNMYKIFEKKIRENIRSIPNRRSIRVKRMVGIGMSSRPVATEAATAAVIPVKIWVIVFFLGKWLSGLVLAFAIAARSLTSSLTVEREIYKIKYSFLLF